MHCEWTPDIMLLGSVNRMHLKSKKGRGSQLLLLYQAMTLADKAQKSPDVQIL